MYTRRYVHNVGTVRTVYFLISNKKSLRVNQTGLSRARSLSLVGLGDD